MNKKIRKLHNLAREYQYLKTKEERVKEQKNGVSRKYHNLKQEVERLQVLESGKSPETLTDLSLLSPELRIQVESELRRKGI